MRIAVVPIELGTVTLPDWHPRAADGTCPIRTFAIDHPDGVIVFDTGPGDDHETINELYAPDIRPISDALNTAGFDERDVTAIVNSHLHFDHCGQNRALPHAPVWVQRAEVEAATAEFYTVPEWATIEPDRARVIDGDVSLAPGVRVLATPGHTPGHQSVLVDTGDRRELIVGQACYLCSDFEQATVPADNLHDPTWSTLAARSIERLVALRPDVAHFSHDPRTFRRAGDQGL
jgi:N-acyl homoserine lactone hydrolase